MEEIKDFRSDLKNSSSIVWNKHQNNLLCGDNTNNLILFNRDSSNKICKNQITLEINEYTNINSIAINPLSNSNECIIAHSDRVALYSFDEEKKLQFNTMLCKSFLPYTHIQYDHEGVLLFVSSKEPDLMIFNIEQKQLVKKIATNDIGIRTFALSSNSKLIASVNMNGSVSINALDYGYNSEFKRNVRSADSLSFHNNIIPVEVTRDPETCGCKIAWYPKVEKKILLAIPSDTGTIVFLFPEPSKEDSMLSNWKEDFLSSANNYTHGAHNLNMISFDENGSYLLSSDMSGKIILWDFNVDMPTNSVPLNVFNASIELSSPPLPLQDMIWDCLTSKDYNIISLSQNNLKIFNNVLPSKQMSESANHHAVASNLYNSTQDEGDEENVYAVDDDNDYNDEDNVNCNTQIIQPSLVNSQVNVPQVTVHEVDGMQDFSQIMQTNNTQPSLQGILLTATEEGKETLTANHLSSMKRLSKNTIVGINKNDDDDDISFVADDITKTAPSAMISNTHDTINVHEIKKSSTIHMNNDEDLDDDNYANEDDDDDVEGLNETDLPLVLTNPTTGHHTNVVAQRMMQSPFQPSSTKFDDKDRRYLVWNSIGSIILRRESIDNRIEFRFTNTGGSNRNETIIDRVGYVMGSLSYEGAVFASEPEDFDEQQYDIADTKKNVFGSTIYYHAFPGQRQLQGVNESFQFNLPAGEAAISVAVGLGWIAIATSRNLLYIYSSVGHLCFTAAIPGVVITMTGFNFHLGIIYQSQSLQADLYEINWDKGCSMKQLAANIPLPLPSPKHILDYEINKKKTIPCNEKPLLLEWIGFDVDNCLLSILDDQGMCWSLIKVAGWKWVPVFDTFTIRKDINYLCWPVMIKQDKLVYIQLNGESMPSIHPQPVVYAKPLKIPFPSMKDGKELTEVDKDHIASKLWNQALSKHCESELADLTITSNGMFQEEQSRLLEEKIAKLQYQADKAVLEALQIACQKQLIPLALSLAMQIRTEKVLRAGIKVANMFGRAVVANLLANILEEKEELAMQLQQGQYVDNNLYPGDYESKTNVTDSYEHESSHEHHHGIATNDYYSENNTLTNKVKNQQPNVLKSKNMTVSPMVDLNQMNQKPPRNPFLKTPTTNELLNNNTLKRKNVYEGLQDMKASPSPKKIPSLNRQTSFSKQARMQSLSNKRIL